VDVLTLQMMASLLWRFEVCNMWYNPSMVLAPRI
jgi:hypothetical protein